MVCERDMKRRIVLLNSCGVSKTEFVFSCCGAGSVGAGVERARTRPGFHLRGFLGNWNGLCHAFMMVGADVAAARYAPVDLTLPPLWRALVDENKGYENDNITGTRI